MTTHLLAISIGPVQTFIVAARRTRDLWFGSHVLSEVSKAAAKAVADSGGMLIFPALNKGDKALEPPDDIDAFNVANIILAELKDGLEPVKLKDTARKAAEARWRGYAEDAHREAGDAVRMDIWNDQVDDVTEFYSAWVPFDGKDYPAARKRLMHLLAGRKTIRNFRPAKGRQGVPKSSLDGARESVLTKGAELPREILVRMRLSEGEQLCAVGLTKRLGGGRVSFPSVARAAVDPWIRGVLNLGVDASEMLDEIAQLCKGSNFASGTGKFYQKFPFDGEVLYPARLDVMLKPKSSDAWEKSFSEDDQKKLDKITKIAEKMQKSENDGLGLGEPDPYLAVLVADGDRMGAVISAIDTPEVHRKFSRKLAEFAGNARVIVEKHNGFLVYSGGDDVLAFLPVDKCLEAAQELHDKFGSLLKGYRGRKGECPTLSIGIAIGHFLEPMEDLLKYGREAEKAAKADGKKANKTDRNGLAVHLHKRGGGDPIKLREQWKDEGQMGLDERLQKWAEMHVEDRISDKTAFDMRQLAEDYKNWPESKEKLWEVIERDVFTMLKRKKPGHGSRDITEKEIKDLLAGVDSYKKLRDLADELILARTLAESMRQARGRTPKQGVSA